MPQDEHSPFGWVKVRGSIEGYEIKKHHWVPMGNGEWGLSVNAGIRKKIKKQAGGYVHIILYPDNKPLEIPAELSLCLQDETEAWRFFNSLNENEQYCYIKWIYSAKTEQTKVDRIIGLQNIRNISIQRIPGDRKKCYLFIIDKNNSVQKKEAAMAAN